MKGDFTRDTFRPDRHYRSVRMQQGRVQLDADWNERDDILLHRVETEALDTIGGCGAPIHAPGFHVVANAADLSSTERMLAGNADPPALAPNDLYIGAGRFYLAGVLAENERIVALSDQADLPGLDGLELGPVLQGRPPTGFDGPVAGEPGTFLAYLDVWQRHLTALDAPDLREVALGGPDTTTRLKTVWQVKLLAWPAGAQPADCRTEPPGWAELVKGSTGRLRAKAEEVEEEDEPCIVPEDAGYRGLENQLYRVEIHRGGAAGEATFKWSRENGSVATRWIDQDGADPALLVVESSGRDATLGFGSGDWVELIDDVRELWGLPGTLVKVEEVRGGTIVVDPDSATDTIAFTDFASDPARSRWPTMRRWDQRKASPATPAEAAVQVEEARWLPLEEGVQVWFEPGGAYRNGDYWMIPARTVGNDVDGTTDASRPAQGITHRLCRLALLAWDGATFVSTSDCRPLFPPVTELTSLLYVSGDGQEGTPDPAQPASRSVALAGPLEVRVANGRLPVEGATVRFEIVDGNGRLQHANAKTVDATTDAAGVAGCTWQLDGSTPHQRVEARLLDAAGAAIDAQVVRFNANLSIATRVAYDPRACDRLRGAATVQEAIDRLCRLGGGGEEEPGIRVEELLIAHGRPLENDHRYVLQELAEGIQIVCSEELAQESVHDHPVCTVTLELPYPLTPSDVDFWGFRQLIGYQPLTLAASVNADGRVIFWTPSPSTQEWLHGSAERMIGLMQELAMGEHVLARLRVYGNFIWAAGNEDLFLHGEVLGRPRGDGTTALRLPSGDRRRGGDLEMWFWVGHG
jgi:hypothetical protein